MSGKQDDYQKIYRDYEYAPGSLNAHLREEEEKELNKGLPGDDAYKYLYDAEQLKDYYEKRNQDTDENSFKVRTKYYFEDIFRADAKARRYEKIAEDEEMIEAYATRHGGRSAHKRKNDVKNASASFRKMQQVMTDQMSRNNANLTPLQKYAYREKVMKYRMEGMVAAAQLKSKPGNMHHNMMRAKLSCQMILKDQLTHLIKESKDPREIGKLQEKLDSVNSKIDNIYRDLQKYTPSIQKQWQESQFTDEDYRAAKEEYSHHRANITTEDAKLLFHLQKFHEKAGNVQWPARCVYKSKEGNAPINPAERKMEEWNTQAQRIREVGTPAEKRRLEEEGIRIFMSIELPDAETLEKQGTKYLEEHLRTYYEMTHFALDHYNEELKKEGSVVYEYAEENEDFRDKLEYVTAIRAYMDQRLKADKGIQGDEEKGYRLRSAQDIIQLNRLDDNYADAVYAQNNMGDIVLTNLKSSYRYYKGIKIKNNEKHSLMPVIPIEVPVVKGSVQQKRAVKGDMIAREAPKEEVKQEAKEVFPEAIIIDEEEEVKEEVKQEAKEVFPEAIIIDEEEEEVKEAPKQEVKEEIPNMVIIEEEEEDDGPLVEDSVSEVKSVPMGEAFEEVERIMKEDQEKARKEKEEEEQKRKAEEDRKKKEAPAREQRIVVRKSNPYLDNINALNEKQAAKRRNKKKEIEENRINENRIIEHEENENRIIVHEEAPVRMIQSAAQLTDHVEYQKLIGEADAVFEKYLGKEKDKNEKNEAVSSMMRLVHFDKKGVPVTEKDKENHEWNLKWLTAWKNDEFDTREEMIKEELQRISDAMPPLPILRISKVDKDTLGKFDLDMVNKKYNQLKKAKDRKQLSPQDEKQMELLAGKKLEIQKIVAPYLKKLDKWMDDEILEKDNDVLTASLHKMGSIKSLQKAHPGLEKYRKKNSAFDCTLQMAEDLTAYLDLYQNGEKAKKTGKKKVISDEQYVLGEQLLKKNLELNLHAKDPYVPYQSKDYIVLQTKKEQDEEFLQDAHKPVMRLTEAHFSKKPTKAQKMDLEFARARYDILKFYNAAGAIDTHKEYQDLYKKLGFGISMDRMMTGMMRLVLFDKNGKPLSKYKENHKWNLRWLNAWVNKDEKEKEKMIAEYYPHTLDELKDTDFPEVKLSKDDLKTLKAYKKLLKEETEREKGLQELYDRLQKKNPEADPKKDPQYAALLKERKQVTAEKTKLLDDVLEISKDYVFGKQFQSWVKRKVQDRSEHEIMNYKMGRANACVDDLAKECPSLSQIESRDPKFAAKRALLDKVTFIYNNYVLNNYGVKISGNNAYHPSWYLSDDAGNGGVTSESMMNVLDYLTTWMDYHYEEIQGKEDDEKELARIQKEENSKFKAKDYPFYKKAKAVKELTLNPIYRSFDLKKTKEKYHLGDDDSLDRFAYVGFRPVTFDGRNQPLTKEDEENHAWNLKWMKAWEEDDVTTREAMIEETLPHLYDEIKLPDIKLSREDRKVFVRWAEADQLYENAKRADQECEENSPKKKQLQSAREKARIERDNTRKEAEKLGKKYWGAYTKWLEGLAANQDLRLAKAGFASGCFDKLEKIHPSVAHFFKTNPAFQLMSKMVDTATRSFGSYVTVKKCNLTIGDKVSVASEESVQGIMEDYQESMTDDALDFLKNLVMYDEVKTAKTDSFVSLSGNENYLESQKDREEYAALVKEQPNLTQKGYQVYKLQKRVRSKHRSQEYNDYYNKVKVVMKEGGGGTLSRDAVLIMRHVDFDEKGNPVTKQDMENHKWNLKWLKAIDEDDYELREKMIAEEIPNRFWIKDMPRPSEKLLSLRRRMNEAKRTKAWSKTWDGQRVEQEYREEYQKFQKELERYTEEKLDQKDYAFFEENQDELAYDALKRVHPSLKQYLDNNPEIKRRSALMDRLGNFCGAYIAKKYLVVASGGVSLIPDNELYYDKNDANQQEIMDAMTNDYLDRYMEYQKVENEPGKPYQSIIREEDRKKKEKRAEAKAAEEKKAKEEEEKRKKSQPRILEFQKINPKFNPDFYEPLERTNVRGKMFQNKEYLALAKKVRIAGFGNDLDGAMSFALETIEMDEKGNVLPEYKEAHERNLAWLNSLIKAGEDDDLSEVKKQVEEAVRNLVKSFTLPDNSNISSFNALLLFLRKPEIMMTNLQKLRAYEKILKGCPEVSVSSRKLKELKQQVKLLLEAAPILVDEIREKYGIDFSGNEFRVVKPNQMTEVQERKHSENMQKYLKAREDFVKEFGEK